MKLIFFLVVLISVPTLKAESEIYLHDGGTGFLYTINLEDIQLGQSARLIRDGFLLGHLQVKGTSVEADKNIREFYLRRQNEILHEQEQLENSRRQLSELVDGVERKVTDSLQQLDSTDQFLSAVELEPESEVRVRWHRFEDCARRNLPLIKKALYYKQNPDGLLNAEEYYHAIQSLYTQSSVHNGMICGDFVDTNLKLRFDNEVSYIKFFSSLLKRGLSERKTLFETYLLAYSQSSPQQSRLLNAYLWARLSWHAVTQETPLPELNLLVQTLKQELRQHPLTLNSDQNQVTHQILTTYDDIDVSFQRGQEFIVSRGLSYE
jgi:hypothetical protein